MADRMHPYPMFPQNLTSNSLQQSQIPQQPPPSQQPDPQMISALSNPEHSRMWQQMNQLQNSYRQQQSGDLAAASQMNHQMQEFSRGQAFSHGQGQPMVQQMQQPFGLNAQRMNPSGSVFHDPQANQPQSLMPSSFPNVPMNTQQQLKATFNMNPVVHATMSNPNIARQLKMQEMARLQQSSLSAQHALNQPSSVDMFTTSSMQPSQEQMHGSPHSAAQPVGPPGPSQGIVPTNQQQAVQKRMLAEFQERRAYLLGLIAHTENAITALLQNTRTANDPHIQQKLIQLRAELANRKDMHSRYMATFGAMVTQQMATGMPPSNMSHINPMTHSISQQPQQPPASSSQVQPGFVAQSNQPVAAQYKYSPGSGPSPIPTQTQAGMSQQHPAQPTPIGRPNTIPPRTQGTPHQIPSGPMPNSLSPNPGSFATQGGQKASDQTIKSSDIMPLPLDKPRFESTYTQFCRSQNINPSFHVPLGDNRVVDLHQLHVYVMHEGGSDLVNRRDMWAVIGGRLGFIQFPGSDTEPARCGPAIAQQIHSVYERLLQHFENAYALTVKNRPTTGSSPQPINQMNPNPPSMGNNATSSMSGNPAEMPPTQPRQFPNQQFIATALRFVSVSAQDMRTQRVPEHMINFVERHRSDLVKVYQQQMNLLAKRNVEQGQQNMANPQGSSFNTHEQVPVGMQPSILGPQQQSIGANAMANVPGEAKMPNGSFVPENVAAASQKQPTQDQIQHAMLTINQFKQAFQQRSLPAILPQHIPVEKRVEYNQLLEQVYKTTSELEPKLPMYFAVFRNDDALRKYVAIVMTVAKQRQLSAATTPQYIISPLTLRNMQIQVIRLNEEFGNRWRAMKTPGVATIASSQQHPSLTSMPARASPLPVPPVQNISQIAPSAPQNNGRPTSTLQQPAPSQSHLHPPPPPPHLQPTQTQPQSHSHQQSVPPPPTKKNFAPSIPPSPSALPPSVATLTPPPAGPVASSSTPATSAPTPQPTVSSPQTPKSPPSKAAAKSKAPSRAHRKMSAASRGPATPEVLPSVAGVKRPPEEDVATLTSVAPSEAEASNAPSPKKVKTEWDGEVTEGLRKKQQREQEIERIETAEEAASFFDQMKELLAMTASTDNDINHDIASTLGQILAGVAQDPVDAAATAAALSLNGAGNVGPPPTALSPHMGPANDAFLEFIDFSSFTTLEDDDNDSKAPTPDLVHSSETNPSPESGSDGDSLGGTGSPDKTKIEEPGDRSDPLRLGALGEIDGGESAYYQGSDWKWAGPMYTLEQPWAISTS